MIDHSHSSDKLADLALCKVKSPKMTNRTYKPQERAGIWIDQKTAYVIKVSADDTPMVEKIDSGIRVRGSPADDKETFLRLSRSDPNRHDKLQQHNRHEMHTFFHNVMERLRDVDFVYLFGPGAAKLGLNNEIEKEGSHYRCKVTGIEVADKLTENQMKQQVIEFFTSLRHEDSVRKLSLESSN